MGFFKLIQRKVRASRLLSLEDWGLFVSAWILLVVFDLALRVLRFPLIQRVVNVGLKSRLSPGTEQAAVNASRVRSMVELAARNHIYPMTCLRQSLTLQWLLGRRGVRSVLKFGVRQQGFTIAAHSWIEYSCSSQANLWGPGAFVELVSPLDDAGRNRCLGSNTEREMGFYG
jgi:hypothetical protein